ncbi:hypothetical protein HFP51_11260 [Parasphingopyxis sp. CP4]|uniref:aspartyl protease family protein n=1 Tax=Parasphingopyxis sp. CP4 TaxID=2724527 RepID=UPI0015A27695|nr:aspartyl protease family protein [Parasphingopyxis sp. CP4]QLC22704.1 hypothetical protein HFP51_11260 [Parasphingopyxis sp. CP4]
MLIVRQIANVIAGLLAIIILLSVVAAGYSQRVTSMALSAPWHGLPQISVTLNDSVQGRFIVDTAASKTMLTRSMVGQLGLAGHGQPARMLGSTGSAAIEFFNLASLRIGAREFRQLGAYSLPGFAGSDHGDGLIGADILRQHVVDFDLPGNRLRLFAAETDFSSNGTDWVSIPFIERADGLLIVPVTVGRIEMPALFDTGAAHSIMNQAAAEQTGLQSYLATASRGAIGGASGHAVAMQQIRLDRFTVGGFAVDEARMGIADLAIFETLELGDGPAMLLSADAFAGRRFVVDYPRNRLLVAPQASS